MQEKFSVVLEAITDGFNNKMQQAQNIANNVSNNMKAKFNNFAQHEKNEFNEIGDILKNAMKNLKSPEPIKPRLSIGDLLIKIEQLKEYINKTKNEMSNFDIGSEKWKLNAILVERAKGKLKEYKDELRNMQSGANEAPEKSVNTVNSIGKSLGSVVSKGSKFGTLLKGFSKIAIFKMIKDGLENSIKRLKIFSLAILGARSMINGLRKAVSSYLSYDTQLSNQLNSTWSALGAQFAPVIEYVINLFSRAVAYINAFTTALTGINMVARANKKALDGQTKSANKSLSAMDEITNINKNQNGGSGANQIKLPEIKNSDFLNSLTEKIKARDWYGVGETIALKLNDMMDSIDWKTIHKKAQNIGTGIAQFINGGVENFKWKKLGSTIGNGINTAIYFAESFIKTLNFKAIGEGLSDSIYGFFSTVKWGKLAITLVDEFKGVLDTLIAFVSNDKAWIAIAAAIGDFVLHIDWEGIWTKWYTLMMSLSPRINTFILYLLAVALDALVMGAIGLVKGFVNAVKDTLGINSPSTAFIEIGRFVVEGFIQPILEIPEKIKGIFERAKENAVNAFSNAKDKFGMIFDGIKEKFSKVGTTVGNVVGSSFKTVINGVLNKVSNMINGFIRAINSAVKVINKVPGVNISRLAEIRVPQLNVGTNYVPEDQYAYIHKGEAVIPKKFNSAEYFSNINNNEETNALLFELNKTLIEVRDKPSTFNVNGKELARTTYNDFESEKNRLGTSNIVTVR